ncbi:hypothetical protein GGI19_002576, partial [Coemansia pectinata]
PQCRRQLQLWHLSSSLSRWWQSQRATYQWPTLMAQAQQRTTTCSGASGSTTLRIAKAHLPLALLDAQCWCLLAPTTRICQTKRYY